MGIKSPEESTHRIIKDLRRVGKVGALHEFAKLADLKRQKESESLTLRQVWKVLPEWLATSLEN